ncbi:RNA polymerase sigma factor [Oceanirhabdus seepicola]|uniref:Sigma-70 family RNA polymerase sigma factor n=1 Tax=Oceanirhabdus seepicola TaxID=2828781 RepID=A0A9J6NZX4_9CLOT|nr:sigma-70 family RNA polymerase sigma factor [Oceanirhabdus seepicola]MCM1989441.1 sigma-70 family RNA polymerase sigma factor [Oceanirhabdus seepicola]
MENSAVYEKIKESIDIIFSFALKRVSNRYEAEDLSQEIIMNLYKSAHGLKDLNKFHGWMWAISRNVFKAYLRKNIRNNNLELSEKVYFNLEYTSYVNPMEQEQIQLLYRELSILSGFYRETMNLYYIKGKSCDEIAERLNISVNMVKQYLFKSRKKIKEGMNMIRENGERSFNPRKFSIYAWGASGNYCNEIFKKKLPGNIMLEAYYEPVLIEDLSIELGVASVYLEDEIRVLKNYNLLREMRNSKVQSNIIIFTKEFEEELHNKTNKIYSNVACNLMDFLNEKEDEIRGIKFKGNDMSKNTFMWQMATFCLEEAMITRFLEEVMKSMSADGDSSQEYMWGLERKYGDNNFDLGIFKYNDRMNNLIRGIDYYIVDRKVQGLCKKVVGEVVIGIAQGDYGNLSIHEEDELMNLIQSGYVKNDFGDMSLNMPIFTKEQFEELKNILDPAIEKILMECKEIGPVTEKLLKNYAPSFVRDQIPVIASLKQVEAFIVNTMNNMYLQRGIEIPKPCNELLSAFIVLADQKELK